MKTINFFALSLFIMLLACQEVRWQEPDIIKEKKVSLGNSMQHVEKQLGKPQSRLQFQRREHQLSVWNYYREELDYRPAETGGDDMGVLPPSPGIQERYRREYRMLFVDGRLFRIDDYIQNKSEQINPEQLPPDIQQLMDEILE